MDTEAILARRAVVFASAFVYWAGVWVQARRVRRRIGRSPNLKPRGSREQLLWAGWFLVVACWMGQPFLLGAGVALPGLHPVLALLHPLGLFAGCALILGGYAATLWCYAIMGSQWRIGVHREEKNALVTTGPYRAVRHPIYLFQMIMLTGAALLLPTPLSLAILLTHLVCVRIKAADEEQYLAQVHGQEYRNYQACTGRLLPRLTRGGTPPPRP